VTSFVYLPSDKVWVGFIKTESEQDPVAMGYRVIELGPFGSRIFRGTAENLKDIPRGYEAIRVEEKRDSATLYVEPIHAVERKG
jgi:hypothetical protein